MESTYNWYWLVDGLMEQGYKVHLANTAAIQQYEGLKYTDDHSDARWLAHVLRLGVLPEGYIYPRADRPVRDLLRKRSQLVRQRTTNLLSIQNLVTRNTGESLSANQIKGLDVQQVDELLPNGDLALAVKANSPAEMRQAMADAEAIMRVRRHLRPRDADNFTLETADEVLDFWGKISRVLFVALPGLVAVSLVVGGIVIMNIMLMAVAERTREIGIRKALGARRRDILRQFLVEATTLSTVGAAGGVATGIALAGLVTAVTPLPASVAPWSLLVGVLLGAGVGVAAGVYPASRAARLDPIAALRQE